jgi:hypothetical protein
MIGWAAVILGTVAFTVVMGLLLRTTMRPLNETDERCSQVDEDLDLMYGGWRN